MRQRRYAIGCTVIAALGTLLFGFDSADDDPGGTMAQITESLHEETVGTREPLFRRKYAWPILLAVLLAAFNQLSGISVMFNYAPRIFKLSGAAAEEALFQSLLLATTNVVCTVPAMLLIDYLGRRTLLLIGSVGMAACMGLVSTLFFRGQAGVALLVGLIGFIAFFAFSQGAVIWVYLSEIFPNRLRAKGQALGTLVLWCTQAGIATYFPPLADRVPGWVFGGFALAMVAQLFFVWLVLPETKGVSLEEMQRRLGIT